MSISPNTCAVLSDGAQIPLSSVKGQPDTIDIVNFRRHLKMLVGRPEHMDWPGYSRFTHDVVPDKFRVHASMNLVLVEGNYVLVNRGPFQGVADIFDLRIYVDGPAPKIMANLMERHIAGGKTVEQAKDWVKRIDLPNARIAESSKSQADVVIERDHEDDLSSVSWRAENVATTSTGGGARGSERRRRKRFVPLRKQRRRRPNRPSSHAKTLPRRQLLIHALSG